MIILGITLSPSRFVLTRRAALRAVLGCTTARRIIRAVGRAGPRSTVGRSGSNRAREGRTGSVSRLGPALGRIGVPTAPSRSTRARTGGVQQPGLHVGQAERFDDLRLPDRQAGARARAARILSAGSETRRRIEHRGGTALARALWRRSTRGEPATPELSAPKLVGAVL